MQTTATNTFYKITSLIIASSVYCHPVVLRPAAVTGRDLNDATNQEESESLRHRSYWAGFVQLIVYLLTNIVIYVGGI